MDKPIIFLDLETTGTNILTDRIVQIAATKSNAGFTERDTIRKYLVNPGVAIPKEATEIHGITDEMVKDKPPFKQITKGFLEYIKGCDICGFNIIDFDVPLLYEEITRAGHVWDTTGIRFFDSHRIFKYKEKRDLAAAMVFYVGEVHEGAHDAGADIIATASVFTSQLEKYPDLKGMSPEELEQFCAGGRRVDLAGKILLNDQNKPVYAIGKAAGKEVAADPGFGEWMLKSDFPTQTKEVLRKLLYKK